MAHFASVNQVYVRRIPLISPPSRACVQLPDDEHSSTDTVTLLRLEAIIPLPSLTTALPLSTLHVQSISRWAPSCIGPYAQSKTLGPLVIYSGVIPLDPGSMTVVGSQQPGQSAATAQSQRALLSCQRVAVAMGSSLPSDALAYTVYYAAAGDDNGSVLQSASTALDQLQRGEVADWDPLALKHRPSTEATNEGGEEDEEEADFLGLQNRFGSTLNVSREPAWDREFLDLPEHAGHEPLPSSSWRPLTTYVGLPALPRGCLVEVRVVLCDAT